jgi:signal transduction histidine kinase
MKSFASIQRTIAELLRPPVFSESFERTRVARLASTLVLLGVGICLVALAVGVPFFFSDKLLSVELVSFFLVLCLVSWFALRRGNLTAASAFLVVSVHLIAISNTIANGGIESKDNLFFAVPVVISPLLLPLRWALVSAVAAIGELTLFAVLALAGIAIPRYLPGVPLGVWFLGSLILVVLFRTVRLSVEGWTRALDAANQELQERKRTEAERDRLQEALFQAQKMESLGRMAGSIVHDFNNLLMVVTANLGEVKCLPNLDQDLRTALAETEKVLTSAYQLNRSLMDFSRKRELRLEPLDIDRVIDDSLPVLSQLLGKECRLEVSHQAPGRLVHADKTGIMQVLHNLVVNARDAMEGGGVVYLQATIAAVEHDRPDRKAGSYVQLAVRDRGCGMRRQTLEKIFEPFFTTKARGTGLGLATVFGVVRQHGGFIEVDSEEGKGTEFRIFLPCPGGPGQPTSVVAADADGAA